MNIIIDPVFGEMKYIYGWVKSDKLVFNNCQYPYLCIAESNAGGVINKEQQSMYSKFKRYEKSVMNKISKILSVYNNPDGDINILPNKLLFSKDGIVSMIFTMNFDQERLIKVTVYPKLKVEEIPNRFI